MWVVAVICKPALPGRAFSHDGSEIRAGAVRQAARDGDGGDDDDDGLAWLMLVIRGWWRGGGVFFLLHAGRRQ
jgi:hypothetical protein